MLFHVNYSNQLPTLSKNLPLTCISLKKWILITLNGQDMVQFLHNQFTCDIKNLNKNQHSFSTCCNSKGRTISNMHVFYLENGQIAFLQPLNIYKKQILEMQKYAIFSKVTIIPDYNAILIGITGINARKYLNTFFTKLPNQTHTVIHHQNVTLLYFNLPIERFLLIITKKSILNLLLNQSQFFIQFHEHDQWTILDIEAGYPSIEYKTSEIFLPQSINMDILKGINFKKGCYIGQEIITRMQYCGNIKQKLYLLIITTINTKENQIPTSGDQIELKIHEKHWKQIGTILQSCQIESHDIWIQAVLNQSISKNNQIRIKNEKNIYMINLLNVQQNS